MPAYHVLTWSATSAGVAARMDGGASGALVQRGCCWASSVQPQHQNQRVFHHGPPRELHSSCPNPGARPSPPSHPVAVGSCRLHHGGVSRQLCRDAASRQSRSASASDRNRLRKMSAMLNMVLIAVCLFFSLKTSEATEMHPERTFITDNTIS